MGYGIIEETMRYHTRLKNEIRQIQLDTIAIRRIRKEMEEELNG